MPLSDIDYVEADFRWPALVGGYQIPVRQQWLGNRVGIAQQVM
jgi:hypothetical protein